MNDPDNLAEFEVPAHYGDGDELPCFACWLETVLEDAAEVHDGAGQSAYEAALTMALGQIADCLGALFASITPGTTVLRDAFILRLSSAMLLEAVPTDGRPN